jgi:hypothetical protein
MPTFPRGEVGFTMFLFLPSGLPKCWRSIFLILPKLVDAKLICQTAGDALTHEFKNRVDVCNLNIVFTL